MSETKHTPTPWRITATEGHDCLVGSEYDIIATCDWGDTREQDIANAAHIVKCVNAHDALVDTLERILRCDEDCQQAYLAAGALSKLKEVIP